MFIRSNAQSQEVWQKMIEMMSRKLSNEQFFLQSLLRKGGISLRFLPREQFRNGAFLGGQGAKFSTPKNPSELNSSAVAFVHANWVIGVESKIRLLDYYHWWKPGNITDF